MALTRTWPCLAVTTYRQSKVSDRFQLLITKKEVECDYVGVDATALVATGLRLAKNVSTEQRRHKEVARHVAQSLQQLLKKVRCKKSLLLAMDGAETLLKAERTRSGSLTRKLESRLMRLPGTALMQAVEERLVRMMPERQILPVEVVFSGTCVQGCVEQKMSAWALDLASRDTFNGSSDSLCLIGASELYLNVMALSPFYNITSVVQNNADLRQMRLQDILEWLELDKKAKEGESVTIAKMRTDILFLFILAFGASSTELNPLPGLGFHELVEWYVKLLNESAPPEAMASQSSTPTAAGTTGTFLFEDAPGNTLRLNLPLLCRIMQLVTRREAAQRADAASEAYLEHALQTHAMLCLGEAPAYDYLPTVPLSPQANSTLPGLAQFTGHLNALCGSSPHRTARCAVPRLNASESPGGGEPVPQHRPLTAAEYTILCQSLPATVEGLIHQYVGVAPKPEVGKMITAANTLEAHRIVREVLSYANPLKPHKCLCLSPSYCWLQSEKTQLWRFKYVDIGVCSHKAETRRHRNAIKGVTLEVNMSRDGPACFAPSTATWEPILNFPCGAEEPHAAASPQAEHDTRSEPPPPPPPTVGEGKVKTPPQEEGSVEPGLTSRLPTRGSKGGVRAGIASQATLKLLTWNVMFDRYSGKPTPLGMPGIDWCSRKRYPVLAKVIQQEEADVVGMQEVEPVFWEFLSKQPWMRENYYFSCGYASPSITPWGVLMLVHRRRFPVQNITFLNVPAWANHISLMPVVRLQMPHGSVHVAVAHLLAPYTKSHETARTSQDSALRHHMVKTLAGDAVTMGDFNDWPTREFYMPAESHYVDCWPLLRPHDAGKTMDETNTFCKLKVEEMFYGRSDKLFLRSRHLVPVEGHLVGTKSVNDENGNKDAPAYLFPSDHYGVSMTFALKPR
ncbi:RNA editing complex protein MP100 [Trypanosoma conorhini]|uniref:RNA editing complex protein MP100 n=1 Tax=Trypanosoma conorhini TaxID=83891 RepID=A0A3R7PW81_9TRYP|nr:RNA editing complex protein MP100 [Trypanosoma conorhini]RNF26116.1 RNA editing complex protein MP100 [Trypanosoma conorhini]